MNHYRGLFFVLVTLGVTIFSTGTFAQVPLTMTHQGRLLDASDQPVNGFFDITYRIFETPSGGSPLWTEVHASVQVADGLFSALLGSTVPLSADVLGSGGGGGGALSTRYLEVSVGGTTLSPRLQLSSVPSAISAGHVSGDIETAPGRFTITNNGGVATGVVSIEATPDSTSFRLNGLPPGEPVLGTLSLGASGTGARSALEGHGGSTTGTIRMQATPDSASEVMEKKGLNAINVKLARMISSSPTGPAASDSITLDSDNDGLMDKGVSSSCDAAGARLKIDNLGSSGQDGVELSVIPGTSSVAIKSKGTGADKNRTITSTTNPETATTILAADLDGDGVPDNSMESSCDANGAKIIFDRDSGRSKALMVANDSGSSFRAINTNGTGAILRCSSSADSSAATMLVDGDVDGDGVPEGEISQIVTPTTTSVAIKTKGTGAEANRSASLTVTGTPGGNVSAVCANDLDGDDVPEGEISQIVTPTTTSVAIKTKGTGADANKTASLTVTGNPGGSVSAVCATDIDGDGIPDEEISQVCTPTTSSMAIKTKGTGADKNRSASLVCAADMDGDGTLDRSVSTTADSNTAGIAIDEPGVQVAMKVVNKGVVKGNITINNGNRMVDFDSDGNGFFASKIGVGKDPIEKIDIEGGAYCDGTNWVNASDRNSKENFTPVDGNELLEQIAQLSITRWNYKGNSQAEHIGPTAQDFKAAFGVGANDKTISTIDPSGIALAAIKALNSKMQELNAKTSQLEDQAREIAQLKAELDAIKALLQKQAATKN